MGQGGLVTAIPYCSSRVPRLHQPGRPPNGHREAVPLEDECPELAAGLASESKKAISPLEVEDSLQIAAGSFNIMLNICGDLPQPAMGTPTIDHLCSGPM